MTDVVICHPLRTPVGRMGGALASLSAVDLATTALKALVARSGRPGCGAGGRSRRRSSLHRRSPITRC